MYRGGNVVASRVMALGRFSHDQAQLWQTILANLAKE